MGAEAERACRARINGRGAWGLRDALRCAFAELDAERAAHAATLAALEAVCDSEGGVQSLAEARAILASEVTP